MSVRATNRRRRGLALVIVLVVLMLLLVMATPFLLMARNADSASGEIADRAEARIALDTAGRHVRAVLAESHSGADRTPYWDTREELRVENDFDPGFLDANDPNGVQWDAAVEDVAAKIDLNSCPPHVLANAMGVAKRFVEPVAADAKTLKLNSVAGLRPEGFLWANGELVQYTKIVESELVQFTRGVLGPPQGQDWRGGPRPPDTHAVGTPVLDQRAFALPLWRAASEDGELRRFESLEELRQAGEFVLAHLLAPKEGRLPELGADELRPLFDLGSVHGGACAGAVWQHPARITTPIEGRRDGKLRLDYLRWVNPGATVRITDGTNTELAIVQAVTQGGEVVLDKVLQNDYAAYRAELSVLARRPVNLNTASKAVLETLFTNLQRAGRTTRVLRDEAEVMARLVIESRPLEGFEDFLRRVILPACGLEKLPADAPFVPESLASGQALITSEKAFLIYRNGLNANDAGLVFSTMPYCFTTRDVYELELRASVNALSGVERARAVRDEVAIVVPQRELLRVWGRQEDFDEELRLSADAPWWMTGPNATTRWEGGAPTPSRLWAHAGTAEGQPYFPGVTDTSGFQDRESPPTPEHVFASRETTAWAQLWPSRKDEMGQRQNRVLHFDHETRDLEGRHLPDQPIRRPTNDPQLQWTDAQGPGGRPPLCRPLSLELWVKPRTFDAARYLDVMGASQEIDRVSLLVEGQDLVLRVLDGVGDHPATPFKEVGEVRYELARGAGPGLPADVWNHVALDVRGNRPSQMDLFVNGLVHGVRRPGLTRLTASVGQSVAEIPVESVEGFPPQCCVRIGNELIEVLVENGGMRATRQETGKLAGFGGRTAREQFTTTDTTAAATYPDATAFPVNLGGISTNHETGTTVELYGYSAPIASRVPMGRSTLASELGPWRVAKAIGVVGASTPQGDPIVLLGAFGPFTLGNGIEGQSNPTGLVLASADDSTQAASAFMSAFHTGGGYAALVQWANTGQVRQTVPGAPLGGVEIIRYSGWSGTTLNIAQRGIAPSELPTLGVDPQDWLRNLLDTTGGGMRRAFVTNYQTFFTQFNAQINASTYVVPISLAVPGAAAADYHPNDGQSHVAQITHTDDVENTEWVRYDDFIQAQGQLVRSSPKALRWLFNVLTGRDAPPNYQPPTPGGGGGGNPGGGGGPVGQGNVLEQRSAKLASAAPAAAQYTPNWEPRLGKTENQDFPLSDAAASRFQVRGVFGTFTHRHVAGLRILPVFSVFERGIAGGRPGSLDAAFLVGANSDHPGWPVRVHHVHRPSPLNVFAWWEQQQGSSVATRANPPTDPPDDSNAQEVELLPYIFVGLQEPAPEPLTPGTANTSGNAPIYDTREIVRLVAYPSGELPRQVTQAAVGGNADGRGGAVPDAIVDEIVFGDAEKFDVAIGSTKPFHGADLILDGAPLSEEDLTVRVLPKAVRIAGFDYFLDYEFLRELPEDAGLLRIGDEVVAYDQRDPGQGTFQLCSNGRGLLGSRPQRHEAYQPVSFLEHFTVSFLANGVGPSDALLTLANAEEFPAQGLVLVGDELIHYTRLEGAGLGMPRGSSAPGAKDAQGEGLFRGRFGTTPAAHSAGEAVILFPFRYWDRWAPRADASELAYFGFSHAQPAAFWNTFFFQTEDTDAARIGVLARTDPDVPWDADPETGRGLSLHWSGDDEGKPWSLGRQSDRADWRVFVIWSPGAFDVRTGMPHGWRQTPRLKLLGASYFAPSLTLRSVQR